jgi:hypothetical protein
MNIEHTHRGWFRAAFAAVSLFGLAGACGGKTSNTPVLGSESHFLMRCEGSCGDDGLACIGGICTRSCITGQDSCTELASSAVCTNESVEPGSVAVCDVGCSTSTDCAELGASHTCDGGYCRMATVSAEPVLSCEDYRDQIPPPSVTGITIVNTGTETLYVWPHSPPCSREPSYVRVVRLSPDGEPTTELNIQGLVCAPLCWDVMDRGWRQDGEGSLSNDCPGADCAGPPPALALEPGETLFEPARTEQVPARLPRACARGIETDFVNCYQRVFPTSFAAQPGQGSYRLFLDASLTPECGAGCERLRFRLDDPSYFAGNQRLEISAAEGSPLGAP